MTTVFQDDQVRLMEGKRVVAQARFAHTAPGVVQVVELHVQPNALRRGHGTELMKKLVSALKPQKMWVAVGHKSQVIARAFLTKHGFHHVSTTENVLRGEDLLIYVKSWV